MRGCTRLLLGVDPHRSGVDSAGNGPAMRAAIFGAWAHARGCEDAELAALVRAATRITHTDPRAEDGALLIARLARQLAAGEPEPSIVDAVRDPELRRRAAAAWRSGLLGLEHRNGVSGFVVDTVPAALACALHHAEAGAAIEAAIRLGGDTDTTAAITGALVGARDGAKGLPAAALAGLGDIPLSRSHLEALARALVDAGPAPRPRWLLATLRNLAVIPVLVVEVLVRALGR